MECDDREVRLLASRSMKPGGDHYRAFVGPPAQYDFMGATQFRLLTALGLREEHYLLDVGCGSLRAGRLLIPYLLPRRYCGLDPNRWLVEQAVADELGADIIAIKRPVFSYAEDFDLTAFERQFDFIVAQSIFSHTGADLFDRALANIATVLAPGGQLLFTVVTENAAHSGRVQGNESLGWIYPGCVVYPPDVILRCCSDHGLIAERIDWFHPRQTWFRCVRDQSITLAATGARLGDGRVLFDERFKKPVPAR